MCELLDLNETKQASLICSAPPVELEVFECNHFSLRNLCNPEPGKQEQYFIQLYNGDQRCLQMDVSQVILDDIFFLYMQELI